MFARDCGCEDCADVRALQERDDVFGYQPRSILDDTKYQSRLLPSAKISHLETLVRDVERALRECSRGHLSAADVCGVLWELGLDPNEVDA